MTPLIKYTLKHEETPEAHRFAAEIKGKIYALAFSRSDGCLSMEEMEEIAEVVFNRAAKLRK